MFYVADNADNFFISSQFMVKVNPKALVVFNASQNTKLAHQQEIEGAKKFEGAALLPVTTGPFPQNR